MIVRLYAPERFESSRFFVDGKCGPGVDTIGDKLVPEKILGLFITEACKIHDYMYSVGKTLEDKATADRVFRNNMVRLIQAGSRWLVVPRVMLANIYYSSVVAFGGPAFWDNKNLEVDTVEVTT